MALYDDASLIFLGSAAAGKETDDASKAYSVKPTNGNGDFTISRTDNLNQTRVGPTGLIEKGRENLLLQSNGLNNSPWTPSGDSTVTTGQSGYDGSSNAFLISKVSEQFGGVNQDVTASNVHTFSAHLKAGSVNFARLFTGPANVFFDLSGSGSIGATSGTKVDATLTSIGNGWFRCTVTVSGSTSVVKINPAIGDNDLGTTGDGDNGTGTGSIFVQDCQLEAGLVATEVITTGAATATAGIKEDEPRFDYPIAGGPPSLLIEPQAINIVTHSEGITLAIKQGTGVVASAPTEASPAGYIGGVVQASNLQGAEGDRARVGLSSITNGDTVSGYFYIKGDSGKAINVTLKRNGAGDHRGTTITHTCDGEWQKVGPMENVTMDGGNDEAAMFLVNSSSSGSTLDSCLLWGYQIEKTSFSTSYIPCHGAAATRSRDDVTALDTSGFSFGTTCTIFYEGIINQATASHVRPVTMFGSHGSPADAERYLLFATSFSGTTYTLSSKHNTTPSSTLVSKSVIKAGLTIGAKVKCASVFNGTSFKFFVNGALADSGGTTTITAASIFNSLDLSQVAADQNHTVGSIILWGSALTNQQCIDLTTL